MDRKQFVSRADGPPPPSQWGCCCEGRHQATGDVTSRQRVGHVALFSVKRASCVFNQDALCCSTLDTRFVHDESSDSTWREMSRSSLILMNLPSRAAFYLLHLHLWHIAVWVRSQCSQCSHQPHFQQLFPANTLRSTRWTLPARQQPLDRQRTSSCWAGTSADTESDGSLRSWWRVWTGREDGRCFSTSYFLHLLLPPPPPFLHLLLPPPPPSSTIIQIWLFTDSKPTSWKSVSAVNHDVSIIK